MSSLLKREEVKEVEGEVERKRSFRSKRVNEKGEKVGQLREKRLKANSGAREEWEKEVQGA